ncbi:MAG: DUF4234 domain-containing protein [Oscillospiraceae bacterium]
MEKRNIALYIVLSFLTCGIFLIYWIYLIARDFDNMQTQERVNTTPGVTTLITCFCGLYLIYAMYKWGKATPEIMARYGRIPEDKSTLYLLLSIFGLSIVALALLQNDLNTLSDPVYPGAAPYQQQPYYGQPQQPVYPSAGVPQQPVYPAPTAPQAPQQPGYAPQQQPYPPFNQPQQPVAPQEPVAPAPQAPVEAPPVVAAPQAPAEPQAPVAPAPEASQAPQDPTAPQ